MLAPKVLVACVLALLSVHAVSGSGIVAGSTKKGVSFGSDSSSDAAKCADLITFNISWYYNWGLTPSCVAGVSSVEFVPMVWSAGSLPLPATLPGSSEWLLGFNEPNYINQAHMDPATAASLWPQLEATGRRLVGPAVADCGEGLGGECTYSSLDWYREFLGNCTGCRIDAVALHLYYCSAQDQINKLTALYELTQRPVWLTEFACNAPSDQSQPTTFAQQLLPRLESSLVVQRYSWFISYCAGCGAGDLLYDSLLQDETGEGHLTQIGTYYSSLVSNSPVTVTRTTNTEVAIDCGQYSPTVDASGISWLADVGFQLSPSTTTYSTTSSIAPSTVSNAYVYQTFRSGPSNYTLPVTQTGSYTVKLLFAEPQYTTVGARVFSIFVQGVRVNSSFDIYRTAKAANTAIEVQYTAQVTAATGLFVRVQLTAITGTPLLAGLVLSSTSTGTPVTAVAPLHIQMSATSGSVTDSTGTVWINAGQFSVGGTSAGAVSNQIVGAPAALQFVYQSNLWNQYTLYIPVTISGQWTVQLLFAETYWGSVGQRVFNVALQGVTVLSNFDIIAHAGAAYTAYNVSLTVTVSPSNPFIVVTTTNIPTKDNALISGIILTPPIAKPASGSLPAVTVTNVTSATGSSSSSIAAFASSASSAAAASSSSAQATSSTPSSTAQTVSTAVSTAASSTAAAQASSSSSKSSPSSTAVTATSISSASPSLSSPPSSSTTAALPITTSSTADVQSNSKNSARTAYATPSFLAGLSAIVVMLTTTLLGQ